MFSTRIKILIGILVVIMIALTGFAVFRSRQVSKPPIPIKVSEPILKPAQEELSVTLEKGDLLISENRLDEALSLYQTALKTNRGNARIYNDIGFILLEKDLLRDSEKQLIAAIELDPNCSECQNNLGILKTRQGQALEAERYFKEAIMANETYPEPYYNLGVLYEKNGDIGNALVSYQDFIRHSTDKGSLIVLQVKNRILVLTGK